jgi:hypothetical protein
MKAVRKTAESHVRKRLTIAFLLVIHWQLRTKCNLFHCYSKALYIPVLGKDDASEDSGNRNKSSIRWEWLSSLEARSVGNGDRKMGRWFNGDC